MRFDAFVGPAYTLQSVRLQCQRCVNLYPELDETGTGKNRAYLLPAPGLELFKDCTAIGSPIRGLWSNAGRLKVAAGTKYFELDELGTVVDGPYSIATDAADSPVQIFTNGFQFFLVSAGVAYCDQGLGAGPVGISFTALSGKVNTNGTSVYWAGVGDKFDVGVLGQSITIDGTAHTVTRYINDTELEINTSAGVLVTKSYGCTPVLNAATGAFLNGYFIVARPTVRQINVSAFMDGTSWDPLDYELKEGHPDAIIGILADHQDLWLQGAETAEIWHGTDTGEFPFVRDPMAVIHQGSMASFGAVSIGGAVGWIGADSRGGPAAYISQGYQPKQVSTPAIEQQWRNLSVVMRGAISFAYRQDGHWFWNITMPGLGTWVYDLTTNAWHERAYLSGSSLLSCRYRCHTFIPEWGASGVHVVGDYLNGKLYYLSNEVYDDAGDPIQRIRTSPHLTNERKNRFYSRFELDMETGVAPEDDYYAGFVSCAPIAPGLTTSLVTYESGEYFSVLMAGKTITINGVTYPIGAVSTVTQTLVVTGNTGNLTNVPYTCTIPPGTINPDQTAELSISRDGGHTWTPAKSALLGSDGEFLKRVAWRRLGKARDAVFQVSFTGKSKIAIANAYLEFTEGDS